MAAYLSLLTVWPEDNFLSLIKRRRAVPSWLKSKPAAHALAPAAAAATAAPPLSSDSHWPALEPELALVGPSAPAAPALPHLVSVALPPQPPQVAGREGGESAAPLVAPRTTRGAAGGCRAYPPGRSPSPSPSLSPPPLGGHPQEPGDLSLTTSRCPSPLKRASEASLSLQFVFLPPPYRLSPPRAWRCR